MRALPVLACLPSCDEWTWVRMAWHGMASNRRRMRGGGGARRRLGSRHTRCSDGAVRHPVAQRLGAILFPHCGTRLRDEDGVQYMRVLKAPAAKKRQTPWVGVESCEYLHLWSRSAGGFAIAMWFRHLSRGALREAPRESPSALRPVRRRRANRLFGTRVCVPCRGCR
ncbi:hypothetical protein VFPBJ_05461 [Purpureocillium lilacinum]|uniref:Uncharacterized protein n=1 Tax=Purpureocillium lilacinum TaxID=33203 RepID=A0A179GPM5_PURLI|nr:hypothetical protein VFPBJ_05461 [Purpureocillium lilacinum]